ncbi:MAG: hypothetical protein E7452_05635 [Ruminococcaceae bacterium]|nr:hypothetical protein [Oscillospiraceae bacterium]
MKTCGFLKFVAGYTAGVMATVAGSSALKKIVKEIKNDLHNERTFVSPDGDHRVELLYGSSETAKGLTYIKITVSTENGHGCKLVVLSRKCGDFVNAVCEWFDNDHFRLLVGNGKHRQCWDVNFDGEDVAAYYHIQKVDSGSDSVQVSF